MEPVVREPHLLHAGQVRGADPAAERVGTTEARVVDEHDQHVGRLLGRRRAGDEGPVDGRLVDRPSCDPPKDSVGDRQHGAIRVELTCGFGEGIFQVSDARHGGYRLGEGLGERLLGCQAAVVVDDGHDGGRARLELLAEAALQAATDFVRREFPQECAAGSTDDGGRQQGRSSQPDRDADAAAPTHTLAAQMVAGLVDGDATLLVLLYQDHALGLDLLVLDQLHQPVEVLLGRLKALVARQKNALRFAHYDTPFSLDASRGAINRLALVGRSGPGRPTFPTASCSAQSR